MSHSNSGIIKCGIDPRFFDEAENIATNFPTALCELIDNSIAATNIPTKFGFYIDIFISPIDKKMLEITIIDEGEGVPREHLENGMFILGKRPIKRKGKYSKLNEHGMGLKNALPWLSKHSNRKFDLRTSYIPKGQKKPIYTKVNDQLKVNGMKWEDASRKDMFEWMNPRGPNKKTGTRIRFRCAKAQAFSSWEETFGIDSSTMTLPLFFDILEEQLGVTYRHFLKPKPSGEIFNSIRVTYWNRKGYGRYFRRKHISAIQLQFDGTKWDSNNLNIKTLGKNLKVGYIRGFLNPAFSGNYKAFYTRNPRAQGYDIVVNGKIIQSRVYEQIWTTVRHPGQNGFAGELFIQGDIPTVLTKDKLDWGAPLMRELARKIIRMDGSPGQLLTALTPPLPKPPRPKKFIWHGSEDDLCDMLRDSMSKVAPVDGQIKKRDTAWDKKKTGIDPECAEDITYEDSRGLFLIECKKGRAIPLDIYQILMYWDGFCVTRGLSTGGPVRAFLIADSESKGVSWLRKWIEKRTDPIGNPYIIKFRTWRYFGLPPRSRGKGANDKKVKKFLQNIDICK